MLVTTVRTVDRAADLPADQWDALVTPDDFYLSHAWLHIPEAVSGARLRYLVVDGPDGLTGGLVTALADASVPWLHGRPDGLLAHSVHLGLSNADAVAAALGPDALMPGLVCGGRHLGRNRVLGGHVEALLDEAERLAAEDDARSVSFSYVDERDTDLREALARRGYLSHTSGRYSWLPLGDGGFDGYLERFTAHRRRRIRAERRKLADAGVVTTVEPLTETLVPRLAELETLLLVKYGFVWRPEQSAAILWRALEVLGDSALVSVARRDGQVDGFALVLAHGDQWYAHRAGFDYARQGGLPLYYDVVYYGLVAAAGAAGVTGVHYGVGSPDAKRSRGCVSTEQYAYVRRL